MIKRLFGTINKADEQDDGSLIVEGIVSSEAVDSDGEIILAAAMKAALPDYMRFANVREMHQPKAAGVALQCDVADGGVTTIVAKIVDSEAVKKIVAGVYKGFSIGAKILKRADLNKAIIEQIRLVEISLVDRPANPDALLSCWKGDAMDVDNKEAEGQTEETKVEPQAEAVQDATPPQDEPAPQDAPAQDEPAPAQDEPAPQVDAPSTEEPKAAPEGDKAVKPDATKGLYSTASLAEVIARLRDVCLDAAFEAEYEGDNSPVPEKLRAAFKMLVEAFKTMASEEADEAADDLGGDKEMMEKVSKLIDEKVGKALQVKNAENKALVEKVSALEKENEELKKKAAPAKGAVKDLTAKAVSKEEDAEKAEGDEVATPASPIELIKAAHASGGFKIA